MRGTVTVDGVVLTLAAYENVRETGCCVAEATRRIKVRP